MTQTDETNLPINDAVSKTKANESPAPEGAPGQSNLDTIFIENREQASKTGGAFYRFFEATFPGQDKPTKIAMFYSQNAELSQRVNNLLLAGGILTVEKEPANEPLSESTDETSVGPSDTSSDEDVVDAVVKN